MGFAIRVAPHQKFLPRAGNRQRFAPEVGAGTERLFCECPGCHRAGVVETAETLLIR